MLKLNKICLFSIIITLITFCSNLLGYIPGISYLQYIIIFLFIFFISPLSKISKTDYSFWIITIYFLYIGLISIFNHNYLRNLLYISKMIFSVYIIYSLSKIDLKSYLKGVYIIGAIMLCLNTISCFIRKDGILLSSTNYPVYILGTRNSMGAVIVYLIIMMLIYDEKFYNHIRRKTVYYIIIGSLAPIYLWSATTVVALIIISIYVGAEYNRFINKIVSSLYIWKSYLIGIIGFLLINVFRMQDYFSFIIESILKRNINFTARTYIWDVDFDLVLKNPLFGYGQYNKELLKTLYFQPENAHSLFFEILIVGGIIGFIIFSYLVLKASREARKIEDKKVSKWINCYFFILMITGVAESTNLNLGLYTMLTLINTIVNCQGNIFYKKYRYFRK